MARTACGPLLGQDLTTKTTWQCTHSFTLISSHVRHLQTHRHSHSYPHMCSLLRSHPRLHTPTYTYLTLTCSPRLCAGTNVPHTQAHQRVLRLCPLHSQAATRSSQPVAPCRRTHFHNQRALMDLHGYWCAHSNIPKRRSHPFTWEFCSNEAITFQTLSWS